MLGVVVAGAMGVRGTIYERPLLPGALTSRYHPHSNYRYCYWYMPSESHHNHITHHTQAAGPNSTTHTASFHVPTISLDHGVPASDPSSFIYRTPNSFSFVHRFEIAYHAWLKDIAVPIRVPLSLAFSGFFQPFFVACWWWLWLGVFLYCFATREWGLG